MLTGNLVGDRLVLGPVYVAPAVYAPVPAPTAPVAAWVNGITLAQADLEMDAGAPQGLALTWWSEATLHTPYTLFVQVLDANDQILAQVDTAGDRPTSTWRAGDLIEQELSWTAAEGADLTTWQRVIVGWYGADGVRLPLVEGGDFVVVATETP